MTITPDQAHQWAQEATDGPWYVHTDPDDRDGNFIYDDIGDMCIAVETAGSDYLEADLNLIAAAPDLAQTVIEQAKKISELELSWDYQHLVLDAAKDEIAALTELLNNSDIYPTAKETP